MDEVKGLFYHHKHKDLLIIMSMMNVKGTLALMRRWRCREKEKYDAEGDADDNMT